MEQLDKTVRETSVSSDCFTAEIQEKKEKQLMTITEQQYTKTRNTHLNYRYT